MESDIQNNKVHMVMRIFLKVLVLTGLIFLLSCNAERQAYRHLQKAKNKAPWLFRDDTTVTRKTIVAPEVSFQANCYEILRGGITLMAPRVYEDPSGNEVTEMVSIKIDPVDTLGNIQAIVDCPDPVVIEKEIRVPYPVETPLTWWKKLRISFPFMMGFFFLLVIIRVVWKLVV